MGNGTIQVLQFAILTLGLAGSLYTAGADRPPQVPHPCSPAIDAGPFTVLIVVLAALNVAMFLSPWHIGCNPAGHRALEHLADVVIIGTLIGRHALIPPVTMTAHADLHHRVSRAAIGQFPGG